MIYVKKNKTGNGFLFYFLCPIITGECWMIGFEFGYWALKYADLKPKYLGTDWVPTVFDL